MLLQAMLGLQQDAPRGKPYVDPALPDWLPDVTLTDLRLGRQRFDIRFWRDGKDTLFNVLTGKRDWVEWKSVALSQARCEGDHRTANELVRDFSDLGAGRGGYAEFPRRCKSNLVALAAIVVLAILLAYWTFTALEIPALP